MTQCNSLVAQNLPIDIHCKQRALSWPREDCHIKGTWDNYSSHDETSRPGFGVRESGKETDRSGLGTNPTDGWGE